LKTYSHLIIFLSLYAYDNKNSTAAYRVIHTKLVGQITCNIIFVI